MTINFSNYSIEHSLMRIANSLENIEKTLKSDQTLPQELVDAGDALGDKTTTLQAALDAQAQKPT